MSAAALLASFYRFPAVRQRISEYCGVGATTTRTAWGIAGYGGRRRLSEKDGAPVPCLHPGAFDELLAEGADIARSLGDHRGNLLHLDVDYVNPTDPAEAHREPHLAFRKLEPAFRGLRELFAEYGLRPMVLMTGQGYHFVMRVSSRSGFYRGLAKVGHVGRPLRAKYRSRDDDESSLPLFGRTHDGFGRLLEFLCHRAIRRLRNETELPVKIADVKTSDAPFICLDLSAYGDPLYERYARCAFSGNQKASMSGLVGSHRFSICLPRGRYGLSTLLEAREQPARAERMARQSRAHIPTASTQGLAEWLGDYSSSPLATFHRHFDEGDHDPPADWFETYDRVALPGLPDTVRRPLANPNPELLKPGNIRAVALHFWQRGWHPRDIAGLLRSKYERDYGWGEYWYRYDAAQRADFYVRILCGALATRVDADSAPLNEPTSAGHGRALPGGYRPEAWNGPISSMATP